MGNIVLLDENTINKIAAGEVVDRPASIVKELVENAIDASAKNIIVEIKNGGISYIRIQDDGDGFRADDTELAFERHATSKIRQESDILKITSMGFRGEALASVAAISKVMLVTKHKDEEVGTKLVVEAGTVLSKEKTASNQGTTLYIKDVFFNVPARFKFLKKDYTEAGYIEDVIIRIALANPSISFKYINNGRTIVSTTGDGKLETAIYNIFGKDIYDNILKLDYTYEDIRVSGVIGLPQISRSSRGNEFVYINTRYVKDKIITSAIEKAYNEKLAINKFPFAVLNVTLNPEIVDVNVHPAKLEVKFENESKVFEAVYFSVRGLLEKDNTQKSPFTIVKNESKDLKKVLDSTFRNNAANIENNTIQTANKVFDKAVQEKIQDSKDEFQKEEIVSNIEDMNKQIVNNVDNKVAPSLLQEQQAKYLATSHVQEQVPLQDTYDPEEIQLHNKEEVLYKYIGSAFKTYILVEIKDKIYIIDQHAAHERLLYERFKAHYYAKDKEIQMLMIPVLVELKQSEMQVVEENITFFENTGFSLEKFSDKAYKITGIPNVADLKIDYKSMFLDLVDELMGSSKTELQNRVFRFLATVACKAAVKGNMNLSKEEHIKLLDEMLQLENPFTCPHGRPTAYEITKYEIERKFGRK